MVGRVLHTLVGYSDQPTALQGLAYMFTLAVIFALGRNSRFSATIPPGSATSEWPKARERIA